MLTVEHRAAFGVVLSCHSAVDPEQALGSDAVAPVEVFLSYVDPGRERAARSL
jgi:hypothetical protein